MNTAPPPRGRKRYREQNVFDAARERLEFVFSRFERVYFSFSAGKDSSVMVQLALDVARRLGRLPIDVLFIDLEAQYRATIAHAEEILLRDDVRAHWICLPINLRNAVSTFQPFWTCWDEAQKRKWVRPIPTHPCVVSDPAALPFFRSHMEFEEFVPAFGKWFSGGVPTACCVGIRSDESLNRFRTIASDSKERIDGYAWTTRVVGEVFNTYPLYDWKTEDVWTAVGRHGWSYNRIYDAMFMAGKSIHESRICQPYGDDQRRGLDLFHSCEPDTWAKVVGRVSGANFGKIYVRSALLGFRKMQKPPGHSWKSYAEFLLSTLPRYEQEWFRRKFDHFFGWWLKHYGIEIDQVPDEADPALEAAKKAPSWRRIARAILVNDKIGKSLSFSQTKRQWEKYQEFREVYGE